MLDVREAFLPMPDTFLGTSPDFHKGSEEFLPMLENSEDFSRLSVVVGFAYIKKEIYNPYHDMVRSLNCRVLE